MAQWFCKFTFDEAYQCVFFSPLPNYQVTNGQGENKMKNLPVPVYLRPLDEKDTSMKVD